MIYPGFGGPNPETSIEELEANLALEIRKHAEYYAAVSDGTGRLTEGALVHTERGAEIVSSDAFQVAKAKIGWPDESDDDKLEWTYHFSADEAGNDAYIKAYYHPQNILNNSKAVMRTKPVVPRDEPYSFIDFTSVAEYTYATTPCAIRANLVAPELFASVRDLLERIDKRNDASEYLENHRDPSDPLFAAMRTAYGILGKCVRPDDDATQYKILGQEETGKTITNVSRYLYR